MIVDREYFETYFLNLPLEVLGLVWKILRLVLGLELRIENLLLLM